MAVSEEECSTARSRPSTSSSQNSHYLAKCVLRGSAILQVAYGHLRSPSSRDVVFGKESSIELVFIGNDGIVQSICEQPVFGLIKDLAILPWNEKFDANNIQLAGRDLLVVISDSGMLSFLTFCIEMNRFFPVTNVPLSNPGNSRNQLGRMLAVDSVGGFVAVSAYEDRFALFSVSVSAGNNVVDKKIVYPPENEGDMATGKSFQRPSICGTIWSMCFISNQPNNEHDTVLAILLNRRGAILNELLLLGWNVKEHDIKVTSQYVEAGPLALNIVEIPNLHGYVLLLRHGDALLLDLRDVHNPCCVYRTNLNSLPPSVEELDLVEEACSVHDFSMDDEGSNDAACALLKLRDHDPMCIDNDDCNAKVSSRYVCSWSWERGNARNQRMILCIDTGELFIIEVSSDFNGPKINLSECLYRDLPCKALLWVGSFLAVIVEMGDGKLLKFENGKLTFTSPIQNISPILDMSIADFHDEKQDQLFVCCGVAPEGSLRTTRSGINVEKLLKTAPIYQGITGVWTMKMKVSDSYHSFLVLSFVEETRVLSVGLSFTDVTDSVGFQPDVCTLASGLVGDGLLIQIHQTAVMLCLPTMAAHSEGIPSSSPICVRWSPSNVSISMGAVGRHFVVISTTNPCLLIVLGVKFLSTCNYEIFEVQHLRLQSEVSCISLPQNGFEQQQSCSHLSGTNDSSSVPLPQGVHIGTTVVIGTHKPSVEVIAITPDQGLRVIACATISLTNPVGTTISGCVPQDVRLVLVDRLYILCGLRNGMLLRFEWPTASWMFSSELLCQNFCNSYDGSSYSSMSEIRTSDAFGRRMPAGGLPDTFEDGFPVYLQLIATRHIGITPVFLVRLSDSLDADIIALSDRPWLLQTARHSLSYTSISFQPSTHVTPVCSAECTKGILFVAENSLHLVEMVHSRRLNVQKFHVDGTPRKVLYHKEGRILLVMRTELSSDTCSSDICCVDPHSGTVLSTFKLEPDETGKCMELLRVGNEHVVVIGTSLSSGPAIMPSGEAESTKGRLIVLYLECMHNLDGGSTTLFRKAGSSSQRSSPFHEIIGYATEQLSSSSFCSSPDDTNCDGIKVDENDVWQLRLAYSTIWPGMVLAICPYLDHYFLASAGNAFYLCGFHNDNPQKVKRFAVGRTRFMITSLTSYSTRIAVGDCRDGILFYSYREDGRKLEQDYSDPSQRLVADCTLVDTNTAFVSDKKGAITVLSCPDHAEDNASPESNLTLCCAYFMGEIGMSIRKGSFSYKLPADDVVKASDNSIVNVDLTHKIIIVSTLLASVTVFIPISREEYQLLEAVQAKLAVHPLTAPVLGNDHNAFRIRENVVGTPKVLDGDMLSQFLELTSMQQEAVLSLPLCAPDAVKLSSVPFTPIPVNQVVHLLEQVHYALN